ncbi:MAG: hypothetical protein Fur0037_19500 [Planctomycetota bacterium]
MLAGLWGLVRAGIERPGSVPEAAAGVRRAVLEAAGPERQVILQERAGALFVNGRRIRANAENYAGLRGFRLSLAALGVRELALERDVSAEDLQELARFVRERESGERTTLADHLARRGVRTVFAGEQAELGEGEVEATGGVSGPSRLRTAFVRARFLAAFTPTALASRETALAASMAIGKRILKDSEGRQGLARLEASPEAMMHGVQCAVIAFSAAEAIGWDGDVLGEVAWSGLLHAPGLPSSAKGPASCAKTPGPGGEWAPDRARTDLGRRSGLAALACAEGQGATRKDLGSRQALIAAVVSFACMADAAERARGASGSATLAVLRRAFAPESFPLELVDALESRVIRAAGGEIPGFRCGPASDRPSVRP